VQLLPLIKRLKIVTKAGHLVDFEPNHAQLHYLSTVEEALFSGRPVRVIVLKARQIGISTMTEAIIFTLAFLFERYRGLVVAHDIPSSQGILSMTTEFWNSYTFKRLYTPKYESKNELSWKETHSSIRISTAKTATAGRSHTIQALHASECAFWQTPETTMLGLRQALPDLPLTFECVESTANGVGNWFNQQWNLATDRESAYVPLFYPWHEHPEYTARRLPPQPPIQRLDSEERALRASGVEDDRLLWRRWCIKNKCNNDLGQFHQEYPTTPEEAFVATGRNVFAIDTLRKVYQPMQGITGNLIRDGDNVKFDPQPHGHLTVFKYPWTHDDFGAYIVGGDPTHTTRGDFACAQVLNRRTMEQVAVWRGRIDPGTFGDEMAKLGRYYNYALLAPEVEGPGYATVSRLQGLQYPNIFQRQHLDKTPGVMVRHTWGWSTTSRSKHGAVGWLLKMISDEDITIHDPRTFAECRDYVTLPDGGYGPASENGFDDTVMALAIAVTCHAMEPPLPAYTGIQTQQPSPIWESWNAQSAALGA
jgi:hypothetical protein